MLKQIYLELIRSGINPLGYDQPDYFDEVDASITLPKNHHIQIGESYLILWQSVKKGEKLIKEVELNQIDNTKAVGKFINIVKTQLN
jgi:hypothetical protein